MRNFLLLLSGVDNVLGELTWYYVFKISNFRGSVLLRMTGSFKWYFVDC